MNVIYLLLMNIPPAMAANEEDFRNAANVGDYVTKLYNWGIGIGSALAIMMLIYAGYLYASSQGNPDSIKQAKDLIIGALVGLALIILAGVILTKVIGISY